ncbi:hypothetical protein FQR65_LT00949 [Abscondita terminalis]|nr:hypothetical protein FQR65_LT00949 [Abscondita terminalis]
MDSKIYEVLPNNPEQRRFLELLAEETEINAWDNSFKPKTVNFSVPAYIQKDFEKLLTEQNLDFKLIIHDGQSEYNLGVQPQAAPSVPNGQISFDKYYRYSEIQDYLKHLSKTHPKYVHFENYGLSYEKRNLSFVRISSGGSHHKPIIFIDAGIHAREWIAPAMALYIIHQLVENSENRYLINNVDWIIIPLANPDGYEYSHVKDRFWRKTRSRGKYYYGVDPNRNFDHKWNQIGSSNMEKSQIYAGLRPFSEPETNALSQIILKHCNHIKLYLTMHSARKCLLYPYGCTKRPPRNVNELHTLAVEVGNMIEYVHGTKYNVGNAKTVLKPTSGTSHDWAYAVAGIELCYVLELPGGGRKGFDLPDTEIMRVVEEVFAGIIAFHKYIENAFSI